MEMVKEKGLASVADLLSGSDAIMTIKVHTMDGKEVKIKRATSGEIATIIKVSTTYTKEGIAHQNTMEQMIWLIVRCMVHPKLTEPQVRKMLYPKLMEIGLAISEHSGLDEESVTSVRNLLKAEPVVQSSD